MAATNIVEYTNPITNIKYTFEFTNRNSLGPDPWVYIDTSVNVLQEDNAGQNYEISVKLVWNNSLLPGQQPVMVQVRCTRDSTAMSSAVSQNGWMGELYMSSSVYQDNIIRGRNPLLKPSNRHQNSYQSVQIIASKDNF